MCIECGCEVPARDERAEDEDDQETTVVEADTDKTAVA